MAAHTVTILRTEFIAPDVKRFTLERPAGYKFKPGQATEVAIDQPDWRAKKRPFTFTNLPTAKRLELVVKIYDGHDGVTKQMGRLRAGDTLLLHDVFGAIQYQGPGFFIAGGAGVTPFIAILRDLHKKGKVKGNALLCSYRTNDDSILDAEFTKMLGKNYLKLYTRERVIGFRERRIDRDTLVTLVQNFDQQFYVCGPEKFVGEINALLLDLGVKPESLVFEH